MPNWVFPDHDAAAACAWNLGNAPDAVTKKGDRMVAFFIQKLRNTLNT
jgi:hypothetical protein